MSYYKKKVITSFRITNNKPESYLEPVRGQENTLGYVKCARENYDSFQKAK